MSRSTRHFLRHYAEMVLAMLLGMAVLWVPATLALGALGVSSQELHDDGAARAARHGHHDDRPDGRVDALPRPRLAASLEMSASMYLPTFAAIALLGAGLVEDLGALMTIEHVAMLLSHARRDAAAPRRVHRPSPATTGVAA